MAYSDSGHRPHADHKGEEPRNEITYGPESLKVTLDCWGPQDGLPTLYRQLQSNWGDAPVPGFGWDDFPDYDTHSDVYSYIEKCFRGETLQQALELFTFAFTIDGVTRAATHQIVRTRVGAGFMQHGGRDNDWRHRPWTMPETIRRAIVAEEVRGQGVVFPNLHDCITDWSPIEKYLDKHASKFDYLRKDATLRDAIVMYLGEGRELYSALVDAGIPWQDARRLLWIGTQTYIHANYNYVALQGVLSKRLEHVMDWEINCVAQLMLREVMQKCPPVFGMGLRSLSDKLKKAAFARMESWPPDGKYSISEEDRQVPRAHRPEQMPFWVLHPDSFKVGGDVIWIPSNGTYPHDKL